MVEASSNRERSDDEAAVMTVHETPSQNNTMPDSTQTSKNDPLSVRSSCGGVVLLDDQVRARVARQQVRLPSWPLRRICSRRGTFGSCCSPLLSIGISSSRPSGPVSIGIELNGFAESIHSGIERGRPRSSTRDDHAVDHARTKSASPSPHRAADARRSVVGGVGLGGVESGECPRRDDVCGVLLDLPTRALRIRHATSRRTREWRRATHTHAHRTHTAASTTRGPARCHERSRRAHEGEGDQGRHHREHEQIIHHTRDTGMLPIDGAAQMRARACT
jgi:hypothetical protein